MREQLRLLELRMWLRLPPHRPVLRSASLLRMRQLLREELRLRRSVLLCGSGCSVLLCSSGCSVLLCSGPELLCEAG